MTWERYLSPTGTKVCWGLDSYWTRAKDQKVPMGFWIGTGVIFAWPNKDHFSSSDGTMEDETSPGLPKLGDNLKGRSTMVLQIPCEWGRIPAWTLQNCRIELEEKTSKTVAQWYVLPIPCEQGRIPPWTLHNCWSELEEKATKTLVVHRVM